MITARIIWVLAAIFLVRQDGAVFFSINHDPGYPKPENTLAELVNAEAKHRVNHFCVVGYRYPDNEQQAWVWWKEGNAIILWGGTTDPRYPSSLRLSG